MKLKTLFSIVVLALSLLACTPPVQQNVQERQSALGVPSGSSFFYEARQIQDIEEWKDIPGKIVILYINFPPGTDNVISLQCRGVPASSTESLEPNAGAPRDVTYDSFLVPVDGVDIYTNELAGRDGTFGEPVHFRQCLTVDGNYIDIPAYGVPYLVSSAPYTFPPSTIKRDFEAEARLLVAEQIIQRGGCVNPETLLEEPCK